MPHPLLIFSQLVYLIRVIDTNSNTEWQTGQIQISLLQKPTDLDLHCLQRQGNSYGCTSAGQGLMMFSSRNKKNITWIPLFSVDIEEQEMIPLLYTYKATICILHIPKKTQRSHCSNEI